MRRSISAMAAVSALAFVLGACGGNGGSADKSEAPAGATSAAPAAGGGATITVWTDSNRQPALESAAKKFESETGNHVELVVKEFGDVRAEFLTQVSNGQGPDITVGANDWLGEFVANGVVAPIELGDKAKDFNDVATTAFSTGGNLYGLPYALENLALIRNTALADSTPATFDEMIAKGKEAGVKYPFLVQTTDKGDPYTYYPFQQSFGAPVFETNADGSTSKNLGMGGANGEAFATWLSEQGKAGVFETAMTYDIAVDAFKKGESPYILGGPWMIEDFRSAGLKVAVEPIPAPGPKAATPLVGVQGFYVSAQSKNQIVANQFLVDYMATPEVQLDIYKAGNRLPALIAAAQEAQKDEVTAGFAKAAEGAQPMPTIPEMGAVWVPWGVTEAQIIDGAEPVAAWQSLIQNLQAELAK